MTTVAHSSAASFVHVYTSHQSWPLLWTGRAIFGAGTESLCVALRILVARWFFGKEIALAMGVLLSFGQFGWVLLQGVRTCMVC